MEFRHLDLLRELAARGSITAVASATYRTPSAVSQQLRTAQRELGATLVEPAGRGIRLTEAGTLLAEGAVEIATATQRVQARWDAFCRSPSGTVTIASVPSAAEFLLPRMLTALSSTSTVAHCRTYDLSEAEFPALVADHDIVICHSVTSHAPAGVGDLHVSVLVREPLDIALPAHHPLAAQASLNVHDVADETWIGVPEGYPFDGIRTAVEAATGRGVPPTQRIVDNRVTEALVAAGHGIAVVPRFTTRTERRIALRPLEGTPTARFVLAMSRPDRAQRTAVQHALTTLRDIALDQDSATGTRR